MDYRAIVRQEAQNIGLDPNIAEAVLLRESGGNPNAVSPAGALGPMQLMPNTAKDLGVNPRDPLQNIQGGVRYLKQQIDQFGTAGGVAAYNTGPGNYRKANGDYNALHPETRVYVPKVLNTAAELAQGRNMTQPSTTPAGSSLDRLQRGLEKARAANDTAAFDEINTLLQSKLQSAIQKAQAAGDTQAVTELQGYLSKSAPLTVPAPGKVESQPLPDITPPENKPQAAVAPTGAAMPDPEIPTPETPQDIPAPAAASNPAFTTPQVTEGGAVLTSRRKGQAAGKQVTEDDSLGKKLWRATDDAVRGLADTITFGYADELAAKADSALGINTADPNKPLVSEKPQTYEEALASQRARDAEGGVPRMIGQVGGALLPTVGTVRAIDSLGRGGRALAGAATGAIQGGLYGTGSADGDWADRVKEGGKGALIGAAAGGVLGGILPATVAQNGSQFIKKAGSDRNAQMDAEIVRDLINISSNEANRGKPLQAIHANALEQKYIGDVQKEIKALGKDGLQKLGTSADELTAAIQNRRILTSEELDAIRTSPAGEALANAIEKAQRTRSMTAPDPASDNILARTGRTLLDLAPIPNPVRYLGQRALGSRRTREDVLSKLVSDKNADTVTNVLERLGPSEATASLDALRQQASQTVADRAAQAQARQQARAAAKTTATKAAENPNLAISELQGKDPTYLLGLSNQFGAPRNATEMGEFSKTLRLQMEAAAKKKAEEEAAKAAAKAATNGQTPEAVRNQILEATRTPLGGAFQELLQGGRSGLNLTTDQAIDALRIAAAKNKGTPIEEAANIVRRSGGDIPNPDAFYGLQNEIRKLQERGALGSQPGALSEASTRSPVINPISYAANVRNAEGALKNAVANAPNGGLAQFANSVAAMKDPAKKLAMYEQRLAQTTDPAEVDFLKNMVEPLTKFGKKAPKADKGPLKVEINGILPENQR